MFWREGDADAQDGAARALSVACGRHRLRIVRYPHRHLGHLALSRRNGDGDHPECDRDGYRDRHRHRHRGADAARALRFFRFFSAVGPETVVQSYFTAINNHDYATAWNLGGKNLGGSYASFAAGFSTTERDDVEILGVSGGTVLVRLVATQTDGSVKVFTGSYFVQGDAITGAAVSQVGSAAASPTAGPTLHGVTPGAFCTPVGAIGVTTDGTLMICSVKPGDTRARWRHP